MTLLEKIAHKLGFHDKPTILSMDRVIDDCPEHHVLFYLYHLQCPTCGQILEKKVKL